MQLINICKVHIYIYTYLVFTDIILARSIHIIDWILSLDARTTLSAK